VRAALLLAGKRAGRRQQLIAPALSGGPLIYLRDQRSGRRFLVDTGAERSLLPFRSASPPTGPHLVGAAGRIIPAWSTVDTELQFNNSLFSFPFLQAAVTQPIIGIDFLSAHGLLVDPRRRRVLRAADLTVVGGQPGRGGGLTATLQQVPPSVRELLAGHPALVSADLQNHAPCHGVEHHIETTGRPVFAKARRLDPVKLKQAKAEFLALEKAGIVRRSSSQWASPLHMVRKKDGSWRPCGDFRRLNAISAADRYPLPNMADITASLAGNKIFSKLDLKKGYHQIPVHEADIKKTAIITPFGLFEFRRVPFGLKNAGMTFQRFMDRVLAGLPFVIVYLDDILVASPDMATHKEHLKAVLDRLREHGLVLNLQKCEFFKSSVSFLGLHITADGASPLPDQVKAICDYPQPATIKQLQAFLGLVNFYRRFLPGAAGILLPLTSALKGGLPGSSPVAWTEGMAAAFQLTKQRLLATTSLAFPEVGGRLSLATDASATHVGAVLQQHGRLAAIGLLLGEAGAGPAQLLNIRQGAVCHFRWDSPLQTSARGERFSSLD